MAEADSTKIIRIVIDASKAVDGGRAAQRALEQIEKNTGSLGGALTRLEDKLGRVGGYLKAHLALMVAELAGRLVEMTKAAVEAAGSLGEMAEQMGITARGLQAMQFSAVQNGVELEQLQTGVAKFSQKMGEAANGSKEMIDALDTLGVKILDTRGQLIPTETLLQRVSAAILDIEDPARRSAAAVDFFGKAGARFMASLGDFAKGTETLASQAAKAGIMISDETIRKLDDVSDAMARRKLRMRADLAELAASALDMLERVRRWAQVGTDEEVQRRAQEDERAIKRFFQDMIDGVQDGFADLVAAGVGFTAEFLASLEAIPSGIANLFQRGMNGAVSAVNQGSAAISQALANSWLGRQLGVTGDTLGTNVGMPFPYAQSGDAWVGITKERIAAAGRDANARAREKFPANAAAQARQEQRILEVQNGAFINGIDTLAGNGGDAGAPGVRNPLPKGSGQAEGEKYAKLLTTLTETAKAQDVMTAAAQRGEQAFEDTKVHLEAVTKTLDIFGQTLDDNDPRLRKIEELLRRIAQGKAAEAFAVATTELQKQNQVLQAQIDLMDQAPEVQARELALLKATQEARKAGLDLGSQEFEARRAAIEQNELLKQKSEELRKANELWTEPLKQALRDLQQVGTDAWDKILQAGKLDFQSLGDVFKTTLRRMVAEFLSLATIRPVMSVVVQGLGAAGLVSSATAGQLGYGGGVMPGLGGFGGGMGSFELPSWLGGGSIGNLMAATPFASAAPAGGFASIEALMASGQAGSSAGWAAGGLGGAVQGLSVGSMLGAGLSIGMGAYSLATSRNTAQTIGGIGQMIGGGMMLIPGMQIPGMIVSVLSSVLPGLFGGEEYKWPPLAGANIRFDPSANGYTSTATEQLGGRSIAGQYGGIAGTIDALYKVTGGTLNPGLATGGAIWNNQREGTTSTYAIHPWLGSVQLSEGNGDQSGAVDRMVAKMFYMTATTPGALTGVSPTLTRALGGKEPTSTAAITSLLDLVKAYDSLGKETTQAEAALKAIDGSFASLTAGAREYGLSLAPIEAEQNRQRLKYAQDFADSIGRELDPISYQIEDLDRWRQKMLEENRYLLDNVAGALDQVNAIEELYGRKRAAIVQSQAASLLDTIQRLTYGDLSGASAVDTLGGTRGTYLATLAQARGGDLTALGRLGADASTYVTTARSFYGTNADYAAIAGQVKDALIEQASAVQVDSGSANDTAQASQAVIASNTQLVNQVAAQNVTIARLTQQLSDLTAQMQRIAVTR